MSVIIISSDSYEIGGGIATETAEVLNYTLLGREILKEVSARYGIDETRLTKALDELPSFPGLSSKLWHEYLAYIQEGTMGHLLKNNAVCHGLAAHLYTLGVSHVLKVRILSDTTKRIEQISSERGVPLGKAKKILRDKDRVRQRLCFQAFRMDEANPIRYDMVISLSQISPDEVVKTITGAVGYRKFIPMTYSIKCMEDRELESRVRANLLKDYPDVRVRARDGTVVVQTKALKREKQKKAGAIKERVGGMRGVDYVEVHVITDIFRKAAESFR